MTTIHNIFKEKFNSESDVYCGRAGKGHDGYFGNPFWMGDESKRDEVCDKFEEHFQKRIKTDAEFKARVLELKDKRLFCFCSPKRCHCETYVNHLKNMSDLMFDKVPVVGDEYNKGNWQKIVIHDDKNIKGFFGDFRFLSNFFSGPVWFEGLLYPSSECAYQAAKVLSVHRFHFQTATAAESKSLWKKFGQKGLIDNNRSEWDERKYDIMAEIVFNKFLRNKELRQKLIDTGDKYLEELNWWSDNFWGVDIKLGGQNNLGKILMKTREFWR